MIFSWASLVGLAHLQWDFLPCFLGAPDFSVDTYGYQPQIIFLIPELNHKFCWQTTTFLGQKFQATTFLK